MTENSTEQFDVDRSEEVDDVEIFEEAPALDADGPRRADEYGTQDDEVDFDA